MQNRRISLSGIRQDFGYTQAELAEKIGVDVTTISRWERGRTMPPALSPIARKANRRLAYIRAMIDPEIMAAASLDDGIGAIFHGHDMMLVDISAGLAEKYPLIRSAVGMPAVPFTRGETRRSFVEASEEWMSRLYSAGSGASWWAPPGEAGIVRDGWVMDWTFHGAGISTMAARVMTTDEALEHSVGRIEFT